MDDRDVVVDEAPAGGVAIRARPSGRGVWSRTGPPGCGGRRPRRRLPMMRPRGRRPCRPPGRGPGGSAAIGELVRLNTEAAFSSAYRTVASGVRPARSTSLSSTAAKGPRSDNPPGAATPVAAANWRPAQGWGARVSYLYLATVNVWFGATRTCHPERAQRAEGLAVRYLQRYPQRDSSTRCARSE